MSGPVFGMAAALPILAVLVILADALAVPRPNGWRHRRSLAGFTVLLLAAACALGLLLAVTGGLTISVVAVTVLTAALSLISNIKRKVLGEPLVFSDFALIGAVFRHPQFYLSALRPWQIVVLAGGLSGIAVTLVVLSNSALVPRLAGTALMLGSISALTLVVPRVVYGMHDAVPDPELDVQRLGLVSCLLAHWTAWRVSCDPQICAARQVTGRSGQLVVVVQCESFIDPADVFGDAALALPGLERARGLAWQTGRLLVSGFGAYTMRTEYGVLFGREEEELRTRRFDPFLTASGETSWALANRLDPDEWLRRFLHPHDMRFYGRDRLMPASGFAELVGEEAFDPPCPLEGRYVTDAAVTDKILELAQDRSRAGLIYAVTIENHGPWPPADHKGDGGMGPYLRLLAHSDAMLSRLLDRLPRLGRPVTLCFFGDHRPSIPGVSEPGSERHTPYVLLRLTADGKPIIGQDASRDLTPAALHHAILDAIRLGEAER